MISKTVDDSRVETVHIVRPNHLNGANRLFGGILMQWIDEVAGIVAKRHCMGNAYSRTSTASLRTIPRYPTGSVLWQTETIRGVSRESFS